MITPKEARSNVGRAVVYKPAHGSPERGVITGSSARFVFVEYAPGRGGVATSPDDLEYAEEVRS